MVFSFLLALVAMVVIGCVGPELAATPTNTATRTPAPTRTTTAMSTAVPYLPGVQIWQPPLNASWQWQLNDLPVDQSFDVDMYDIDLFDNDAAVVEALHAQSRKVICYMNAGGLEDWRPDAGEFPKEVVGANLDDWEGEKWLDIRRIDVLGPIMEARMDLCKAKGFDGIEPDNVDGFLNNTGFPLTYEDQRRYNTWLANMAHERGLSIGLKNDMDQIPDLLPYFDWALNEQCFEYDECESLLPFIKAGKPVFNVEYELDPSEFCEQANVLNFNSMKKNWNLDAWREPCS
ncbi:MAG: endo alpha-1,4 polygalactosaminidase [Dehalococcoidia bacterium]|nr:endo alpha-1,4 polygalactosaminidase [Dehalococcoidia bacterium]